LTEDKDWFGPIIPTHPCLVACICAWRYFLGVQLYSNYTIGC
jgi:hypothetical protein